MERDSLLHNDEAEFLKACKALNGLLGLDAGISPDAFATTFGNEEKLKELSQPGLGTQEIIHAIVSAPEKGTSTARELTSAKVIGNAVTAFWKWANAGFGKVTPETAGARLAACQRCEHYTDPPENGLYQLGTSFLDTAKICGLCGCFLGKKIRLASETCPAEDPASKGFTKWGDPVQAKH